ncbi:hypothetical protein BC828DRAFT_413627 [Blastocladiella britannica]|nr:hypothetical protein BC828DRAFT_413627 [Blastocladiella britannica]
MHLTTSWPNVDVRLPHVVYVCFGGPQFVVAMAAPPTRQWCAQFVELRVQVQPFSAASVAWISRNLAKWSFHLIDMPPELDALHLSRDLVFAKSNLRLMMAVIENLNPQMSGTGLSKPLQAYWQRIVDVVASTCPRNVESLSMHGGSPCSQCEERLSRLWD